jgi:hypothetical protein
MPTGTGVDHAGPATSEGREAAAIGNGRRAVMESGANLNSRLVKNTFVDRSCMFRPLYRPTGGMLPYRRDRRKSVARVTIVLGPSRVFGFRVVRCLSDLRRFEVIDVSGLQPFKSTPALQPMALSCSDTYRSGMCLTVGPFKPLPGLLRHSAPPPGLRAFGGTQRPRDAHGL